MTITPDINYIDNSPKSTTLANFVGSVLTHSLNSEHTATLRSAQMLDFASHFVCPRPLGARKPNYQNLSLILSNERSVIDSRSTRTTSGYVLDVALKKLASERGRENE